MTSKVETPNIDVKANLSLEDIANLIYEEVVRATPITPDRVGNIFKGNIDTGVTYEYRGGTLKASWEIVKVSEIEYIIGNYARSRYPPYHLYGKYVETGINSWRPHRTHYLIYINGIYKIASVRSNGRLLAEATRPSKHFVAKTLDKVSDIITKKMGDVVVIR